jgi:hypothetical protein
VEINAGTFGQYWDAQAVAQFNILSYFPPAELTHAEWVLTERLAQLEAGRVAAKNHPHIEKKLQELDPCLRLRWEFEHPDGGGMWAIDRYVKEYKYHFCLFYWSHTLGEGGAIKAILADSDMQRPDYMKNKKKYQEYALLRNDKLRSEIALAAIDGMSRKQLTQMIEVESALASGEKIRSYGRDAEILNKMHANTKKLDALLHDRASDEVLERVIGEQVKMLDTDPNIVLP